MKLGIKKQQLTVGGFMLTPFGIALRKIRLDRSLRLLDLAKELNLTSSFVSAIETGVKPIPKDYVISIVNSLHLSPEEESELQKAADRTKTNISVDNLNANNRELVAAFARQIDNIEPDYLEEIRKKFLQSISGEVPSVF